MNKHLVTGGLGFIGTHLVDRLIETGEDVICLDNLSSGSKSNLKKWKNYPKFEFIHGDILDNQSIDFDILWHFACPASPKDYLRDPILTSKINFDGTYNLLNLARDQKAKFLFASSSEVYGNCDIFPQEEDKLGFISTRNKRSCYSHGKRIAETLCFDFQNKYNMDIKVVRIFNTYGPGLRPDDGRVISSFIDQGLKGMPLTIYGDGSQTRSFCFISDLIDGLILLIKSNFKGPINLGNSSEISILELAKLIDKKIYSRGNFLFNKAKSDKTLRRCPSLKIIKKLIHWEPKVNLDYGLDLTIKSFL